MMTLVILGNMGQLLIHLLKIQLVTDTNKLILSFVMALLFPCFSCPSGPQQAFRGFSGCPVRWQGVHHQDGPGQPEVGSHCGHPLLSHQETVWTQRHRGDSCIGVPVTGQHGGTLVRKRMYIIKPQIPYQLYRYLKPHHNTNSLDIVLVVSAMASDPVPGGGVCS